ncbi:alpha/beta fold hydrolase [Nocardioides astragali]|uniref:Alpha/beta fold hydrolase n=1 Tax=Nocardioides astragali TaxID=1776736 RepID=A0ABW2N565_9ACTN|nr:alpha/beta hydrolase [Nocardioides astragali]
MAGELAVDPPRVQRRAHGNLSVLHWGDARPRVALFHGRGQNAHTFDSVLLRLGEPAISVDLPGHGHSQWRPDHDYSPDGNAVALADLLDAHRDVEVCVGMSLGGLTLIRLAATRPELVPRCVLIDITPRDERAREVPQRSSEIALMRNQDTFESFEHLCAWAFNVLGTADAPALRRGLWHNSRPVEGGGRTWRSDRSPAARNATSSGELWRDATALPAGTRLLAASGAGVVTPLDAARLVAVNPGIEVRWIDTETHSIHSAEPDVVADEIRSQLAQGSPEAKFLISDRLKSANNRS